MPQELKLLFEILRRWPGGYSFGEYLNAVEQHHIRLRARPAGDIRRPVRSVAAHRPALAGRRATQRNGCCGEVKNHGLSLTLANQEIPISASP